MIPGINDFITDKERNDQGKKISVRRSRGSKGAEEIAKASRRALTFLETGRIRVLDERDESFVFNMCAVSRIDVEMWQRRSDADVVLAAAKAEAEELSKTPWTPLIHVETGLNEEVEMQRAERIREDVQKAAELSKALLQKAG